MRASRQGFGRDTSDASAAVALFKADKSVTTVGGKASAQVEKISTRSGATHSFAESETVAFTKHANEALLGAPRTPSA